MISRSEPPRTPVFDHTFASKIGKIVGQTGPFGASAFGWACFEFGFWGKETMKKFRDRLLRSARIWLVGSMLATLPAFAEESPLVAPQPEFQLEFPSSDVNCGFGLSTLDKGDPLNALELLTDCLMNDLTLEDRAQYLGARGRAFLELGLAKEAVSDFENAATIVPTNLAYKVGLGKSLIATDRNAEALIAFQSAIDLGDEGTEGTLGLAKANHNLGNNEMAMSVLDAAIQKDANNLNAYALRGRIFYERNKLDPAEQDFNYVLERTPENVTALHQRGLVRMRIGDFEASLSDFDRAVAIDDNNVELLLDRVLTLTQIGSTKDVHVELNRIVEMAPYNPRALMIRGHFYKAIFDYSKAISDFKQVMAIDPYGPRTQEAMDLIVELTGPIRSDQ